MYGQPCGHSCNFKITFIRWDLLTLTFDCLTSKADRCILIDMVYTVKVKELILVGIEAMHCLCEGNETTQAAMIGGGHFDPLIKVLTQTRYQSVQVNQQFICYVCPAHIRPYVSV